MIIESEQYRYEDHQEQERIKSKISLEFLLTGLRDRLQDTQIVEALTDSQVVSLTAAIETLLAWIQKNQFEAKTAYEDKKVEFCKKMQPILSSIRSKVPKSFNLPAPTLGEPNPEDA
eukprot:TRINITY_DN476_c0_g2_i3.p1 TRINITY_DN476_c0_g2~~TRINITY_DN476_c0_g2_i3.p1  ORF type:complete len:127 (-),score=31.18 TRINITY_DN476_c0_g2_i3:194-544(-)